MQKSLYKGLLLQNKVKQWNFNLFDDFQADLKTKQVSTNILLGIYYFQHRSSFNIQKWTQV